MNTKTTLRKGSWIQLNERRDAAAGVLLLLVLLALPAVVQAQSYTNNYGIWYYGTANGAITITQFAISQYFSLLTVQAGGLTNGRHNQHCL